MNNNSNLEFRKIPSLKFLYEVNENGTVFRNVKSKKQLKIKLDMHHSKKGYYTTFVRIKIDGVSVIKRVMIHIAVAECWLGQKPAGYEVDHIDRNSHNNDYRNLRYVTKSEQMKNRDHSNTSSKGSVNLHNARMLRAKPVKLHRDGIEDIVYLSFADCARALSAEYNVSFEHIRQKLKSNRHKIYDYDVIYLNAETVHDSFTEQETVHSKSDLTGNYTTAFNKGKQAEVHDRIKHGNITTNLTTEKETA